MRRSHDGSNPLLYKLHEVLILNWIVVTWLVKGEINSKVKLFDMTSDLQRYFHFPCTREVSIHGFSYLGLIINNYHLSACTLMDTTLYIPNAIEKVSVNDGNFLTHRGLLLWENSRDCLYYYVYNVPFYTKSELFCFTWREILKYIY